MNMTFASFKFWIYMHRIFYSRVFYVLILLFVLRVYLNNVFILNQNRVLIFLIVNLCTNNLVEWKVSSISILRYIWFIISDIHWFLGSHCCNRSKDMRRCTHTHVLSRWLGSKNNALSLICIWDSSVLASFIKIHKAGLSVNIFIFIRIIIVNVWHCWCRIIILI